jgi:flagella basal body P-ring formation protein FlgA
MIGGVLLGVCAPASAAVTVELRTDVAVHDGRLTLADLFRGGASEVVLAAGIGPGGQVSLDAARVQAIAAAHGLSWANAGGMSRIIARADAPSAGREAPAAAAAADQPRQASVLAYARDLNAGEVVQPEDLVWSKNPILGVPLDAARDADAVIGQAARRPLRAGAAAALHDVSAPLVIKKDDVIQVVWEAGGIRLALQAKAVTGAAVGQSLTVVNSASRKVIEAVAAGPGQAVVGPEADRLKAMLRTNPKLLASIR